MILSRRKFDRDFNQFDGPDFYGPRGFRGPFGLVFSLVSLGLTIAFNVVGIVLTVLSSVLGGRPAQPDRMPRPEPGPQQPPQYHQAPPQQTMKTEQKTTINKEQVKKTFQQEKEEQTSDWNMLLFVLTLIPVIITLAMKRLDLTALTLAGGTGIIILYNMVRGAVIRSKKNKKQKQSVVMEEKKEDNEIERVIKEAFDKVYGIRKELFRIPKQEVKEKIEGLCDMAEKIIGEVRSNPECMNSVRKFFYYYLDAFNEVFEKYIKLINFSDSSEEVSKLMVETEKSFDDMEDIFKEMCEGMLEKDMLNLKATINVLKNSNYSN